MSFRLVPKSVTLNDLERRNGPRLLAWGALSATATVYFACQHEEYFHYSLFEPIFTRCISRVLMRDRKVANCERDLQGHWRSPIMVPFDRTHTISYWSSIATMSLCCTIFEILSLISQKLKRSRDPEHVLFGSKLSCVHYYSSVSNNTRNLKCIASPIKKIWLGQSLKKRATWLLLHPLEGGLSFQD